MDLHFPSSRQRHTDHVKPAEQVASTFQPKPQRVKGDKVVVRGHVDPFTGYGLHTIQVVADLLEFGFDVCCVPINEDYQPHSYIPEKVRDAVIQNIIGDWEILISPPDFTPWVDRTLMWTMHESDKLNDDQIQKIQRAAHVAVPCEWNREVFTEHLNEHPESLRTGRPKSLTCLPLGIRTDIFKPSPYAFTGTCVFGTAGRFVAAGTRKNPGAVISAFLKAFPPIVEDVQLQVKCFLDCEVPEISDPRVQVIRAFWSEEQLALWFSCLSAFAYASGGEAWGLMIQQALATGRPVLSPIHGGQAMYLDSQNCYEIPFHLVPSPSAHYNGRQVQIDEDHMVMAMREVYRDRHRARMVGLLGMQNANKFSWRSANLKLVETLYRIGYLT